MSLTPETLIYTFTFAVVQVIILGTFFHLVKKNILSNFNSNPVPFNYFEKHIEKFEAKYEKLRQDMLSLQQMLFQLQQDISDIKSCLRAQKICKEDL